MATEQKTKIADALLSFQQKDFYTNSLGLFKALGYNTSRRMTLSDATWQGFKKDFEPEKKDDFNEKKALISEWKEIQLLFQLTTEEMQEQLPMFKATVNRDELASFLFFAIELTGDEYSRSQLAAIAREINKPFPMDVFLLFRLYMASLSKGQQAILNSSLSIFIDEVLGRQLGGGGGPRSVMVYEVKNLLTIDVTLIKNERKLAEAFSILSKRTIKPFLEEIGMDNKIISRSKIPNPLPDRKALDVFDALNLTAEERNEVYWSVAELVKQRLDKATSR